MLLILGIREAGDCDLASGDGALRLPTGGVGQGGGVPRGRPPRLRFETGLLWWVHKSSFSFDLSPI